MEEPRKEFFIFRGTLTYATFYGQEVVMIGSYSLARGEVFA
jgi:hypothetical protein